MDAFYQMEIRGDQTYQRREQRKEFAAEFLWIADIAGVSKGRRGSYPGRRREDAPVRFPAGYFRRPSNSVILLKSPLIRISLRPLGQSTSSNYFGIGDAFPPACEISPMERVIRLSAVCIFSQRTIN